MKESKLEDKLLLGIKSKGGRALKFVSPGNRGVPDRIILMPGAKVYWVEVKTTGEVPEPLQLWWHRVLRALGFEVWVIDNESDLNLFLNQL